MNLTTAFGLFDKVKNMLKWLFRTDRPVDFCPKCWKYMDIKQVDEIKKHDIVLQQIVHVECSKCGRQDKKVRIFGKGETNF